MKKYSDRAIEIINELHTERLDYDSEYLPLINCANQCKTYEDAEEQGLLVRLPCKVGDTLYTIGEHQEIKVLEVKYLQSDPIGNICMQAECKDETEDCCCDGPCAVRFSTENMERRKIFFTREEAERALREANWNG